MAGANRDLAQLGMGGGDTMDESTRNKTAVLRGSGKPGGRQVDPAAKPSAGAARAGARAGRSGRSDAGWLGRVWNTISYPGY